MHKPDAPRRPGIPCQIEALCTARMPQELEDPQPIVTCARSPHQGITTSLPAGRSTPAANHDGRSASESVPASVSAAGRRCGLDGGLHRGSFAWDPGPNLTRKPHEPWVCSPLSGQTYGAPVHSPRGGPPTWSDCSRPSLRIGRWLAPWLVRMGPGPQPHAQTA